MRSDARKRLTEDEDPAVVAWREALGGEVKIITPVQWAEALAEAWDKGYDAGYDDCEFVVRGLPSDSDAAEYPHDNPYQAS